MNRIDGIVSTAKNIFYVVVSMVGWSVLFWTVALYIFIVDTHEKF